MILGKAEILGALRLEQELVPLDGGGEVMMSQIGATDYIKLWTDPSIRNAEDPESVDMSKFTPLLVAYSVVDEKGERIFSDDEVKILQRSNHVVFTKLAEVARRLNGLTADHSKNSEASPGDSSASGSQPN